MQDIHRKLTLKWDGDKSGERIGTEMILPYLSPALTGQRLVAGANFASAGIGVLNDTGIQFVSIFHSLINPYIVI